MKRSVVIAVLLCVVLLICGFIVRREFDAVQRERDELSAQVEALSQELGGAREDIAELQSYAKELTEENGELRDALNTAEKLAGEQRQKLEAFAKTVEELEAQNRATLPSLPALPGPGEGMQGALDVLSELLGLTGAPIGLR